MIQHFKLSTINLKRARGLQKYVDKGHKKYKQIIIKKAII